MPIIRVCPACGQKNRVPGRHVANTGQCGACKAPLAPVAEPLAADGALFDEVVRDSKVPVLVDFWAAWCGPCRSAAPEVAKAAANLAGRAVVLKVDTEAHPEVAARFHVQGIPNFVVLKDGAVVKQQAGVVGHGVMEGWVEAAARG